MSAEEVGLFSLNDLLVSLAHDHNDVWLIDRRQVNVPNLHNFAMVGLVEGHVTEHLLSLTHRGRDARSDP